MSRYSYAVGFLAVTVSCLIGAFTIAIADPPVSRAEEKIRQALDGKRPETNDGMLDDVIGIIQQRGSILDGSSLDPQVRDDNDDPLVAESKRAHVAEQLLKASRLLEGLEAGHQNRADLVNRMRAEAVKLLLE